jgi:hypothetical protein
MASSSQHPGQINTYIILASFDPPFTMNLLLKFVAFFYEIVLGAYGHFLFDELFRPEVCEI